MGRPLTPDEFRREAGLPQLAPAPATPGFAPIVEPESDYEPMPAEPLRDKFDMASASTELTDAELADVLAIYRRAAEVEGRPEALIRQDIERMAAHYRVSGPRGPAGAEEAADLLAAYEGPDSPAKVRARIAAGAIPIAATGGPSSVDEQWRAVEREATREGIMGIPAAMDTALGRRIDPTGEEKEWASTGGDVLLKSIVGAMQAFSGLSALDSIVNTLGGDIPGVFTTEELENLPVEAMEVKVGMEADHDAVVLLDPASLGKGLSRATLAMGLPELEALAAEKLGADPAAVAALRQGIEDATVHPAFDAAAKRLYEENDSSDFDALPYAALPASLRGALDVEAVKAAVTTGALAADPAGDRVREAIEKGQDDRIVLKRAESLPLSLLALAFPGSVPSRPGAEAAYKRRAKVQEETGAHEAESLLKILGSTMIERVDDAQGGTWYYKPSKVQRAMAWAGLLPEMAWEAEIPTGGILNPLPPVLDLMGMDQAAAAIREARVPTKAGWEAWVATGTLDPWLHSLGYEGSAAPLLRVGDTSWAGRVAADIAVPDLQGPGLYDALLRQGESAESPLAKWALGADTIVDVALPVDDFVLAGMAAPFTAGRRAWVGANTGRRAGLTGAQLGKTVLGSVLPVAVGETDALAALHKTVKEGVRREIESGNRVLSGLREGSRPPSPLAQKGSMDWKVERDIVRKLEAAGVNADDVTRVTNELADERARVAIDEAGRMLARGGGPADDALRADPAYLRVKGRYADLAAAGNIKPREADVIMRLLESRAWRATGDGAVASPAEFFELHDVELGGTPGVGAYEHRVSTRVPGEKHAVVDVTKPDFIVGLDAALEHKSSLAKNVGLMSNYGDIPAFTPKTALTPQQRRAMRMLEAGESTKKIREKLGVSEGELHSWMAREAPIGRALVEKADHIIDHLSSNLVWLYGQVRPEVAARSKIWYDGASRLANIWAARYGTSKDATAAVLAALSPQKDWFQNVTLAERVFDIIATKQDFVWGDAPDDPMEKTARRVLAERDRIVLLENGKKKKIKGDKTKIDRDYQGAYEYARGKPLSEMRTPNERAVWIRVYDEAMNSPHYRTLTPEGEFGDFARSDDTEDPDSTPKKKKAGWERAPASRAWGSLRDIAKAVVIAMDPTPENIFRQLGREHKVRNFNNNIYDPSNGVDVTIDTHAVAAAHLQPFVGKAPEVLANFGGKGTSSATSTGQSGTYALYAEAYRRAARSIGIRPRELQSIAWEAVRGLYPTKTKTASLLTKTRALWGEYILEKEKIDATRSAILVLGGGVNDPVWFRSGGGVYDPNQTSSYADKLPVSGIPGPGLRPGAADSGGGGGRAGGPVGGVTFVRQPEAAYPAERRADRAVQRAVEAVEKQNPELGKARAGELASRVEPFADEVDRRHRAARDAEDRLWRGEPGVNEDNVFDAQRAVTDARDRLAVEIENETRKATPPVESTRTGVDAIEARLSAEERFGAATPEDVRDARRLMEMLGFPSEGAGFKVKKSIRGGEAAGEYNFTLDVIALARVAFERDVSTRTLAHELAHRVSTWLPRDRALALWKQYIKERRAAIKANPAWFDENGRLTVEARTKPGAYRWTDVDEWFAERFADYAGKRLDQWDSAPQSVLAAAAFMLEKVKARLAEWFGIDRVPAVLEDLMAGRLASVAPEPAPIRDRLVQVQDVTLKVPSSWRVSDPTGPAPVTPSAIAPPVPPADLPPRHPADTWGDTRGPVGWWMPLDEVEGAIHGMTEEYTVVYDGDGRQVARWGPEDTRAVGADPSSTCVVYPSVLDAIATTGTGLYTHVHPSGAPFSLEDFLVARRANVAEIRAVADGDGFTWTVKRPAGGWPDVDTIRRAFRPWDAAAYQVAKTRMDEIVRAAGGDPLMGEHATGYDAATWRRIYGQALAETATTHAAVAGLAIERVPNRGAERMGAGVRQPGAAPGTGSEAAGVAARREATPVGGQLPLLEPGAEYGSTPKRDGDAFFDSEALDYARRVSAHEKSRETLVYMSPDDFLRIAQPGVDEAKLSRVEALAAAGTQFSDVPRLMTRLDEDAGELKAWGHEGRHRARALKARGVQQMPVLLGTDHVRWGVARDPSDFDYIKNFPTVLRGEDRTSTIPLPDSVSFPPPLLREPTAEYRPLAPPFYSALRRAVEGMKQERFTADHLRAALRNTPGVKADEIEWTSLDRFLAKNSKPTKAETLAWLDENAVVVEEKVLSKTPTPMPTVRVVEEGGGRWRVDFDPSENPNDIGAAYYVQLDPRGPAYDVESGSGRMIASRDTPEAAIEAARTELADTWEIWGVGDAKPQYASYTLPGGTNYREVLFRLPGERGGGAKARAVAERDAFQNELRRQYGPSWEDEIGDADLNRLRMLNESIRVGPDDPVATYAAPHFGDEGRNLLAHARVNDRIGPNGERILFIEEVQSDWAQAGREKGFKQDVDTTGWRAERLKFSHMGYHFVYDADGNRLGQFRGATPEEAIAVAAEGMADSDIPRAPFVEATTRWTDLVLKRLLRMAADGGYDGVAWTPGVVQVRRYEDATRAAVDEVRWYRIGTSDETPEYRIVGTKNGREVYNETMPPENVASVLGKGMAAKIAESPDSKGALSGSDLTIGGEGMKSFYDQILPARVRELTKKWGGRVGETTIITGPVDHDAFRARARDWRLHGNIAEGDALVDYADRVERGESHQVALHNALRFVTDVSRMGVAEEIERLSGRRATTRAHYLPLTPQAREAVLYEGQPLFERRVGVLKGSIEPIPPSSAARAADWLIRFFATADTKTVLHENAHLLRFIMGDKWTGDLVRFFDSEPDPSLPGQRKLTVKGEEQLADAMSRYFRWKIAPRGRVRAFLDELKDVLSDLWMRNRPLPLGMSGKARTWMDAALNPGGPLRKIAVDVSADRLPSTVIGTTTDVDLPTRLEAENVKRTGQVVGDVSTVGSPGAAVDVAVGSRSARQVEAVEALSNAVADFAVETARRKWGFTGDVVKLTPRSVVPANRKDDVLRRSAATMALVVPDIKARVAPGGAIDLDPAEAARMRAHVAMLMDSGQGYDLLRYREGLADPARDFSTMTVDEYNLVTTATIDSVAGPGARADRMAAENAGNAAYGLLKFVADSGVFGGLIAGGLAGSLVSPVAGTLLGAAGGAVLASERVSSTLREWFTVSFEADKAASPAVADAFREAHRALGDVPGRLARLVDGVKKGNPRAMRVEIVSAIARALPAHGVSAADIDQLLALKAKWVDGIKKGVDVTAQAATRAATAGPGGTPVALTVGDLLLDLDDITALVARNPAASTASRESERAALLFLAGWKASPQDLATMDPVHRHQLEDALGIVHDALRRRWGAASQAATEIGVAMSGDNVDKIWVGLDDRYADAARARMYKAFYDGNWVAIQDEIGKVGGATSPQSRFDPVSGAVATLTRLLALDELGRLSEKMLDLGIAMDVDQAARSGRQFEAFTPIGATETDRQAFRARVLHYLRAETSWKMVSEVVFDPDKKKVVARNDAPGAAIDGVPLDADAYRVAQSILYSWGFKSGKDTKWMALVLPTGEEVFVPDGLYTELQGTMERAAKSGLAWLAQRGDTSLPALGRVYKIADVARADVARRAMDRAGTPGQRVAAVANWILDAAGWSYSMSRVNMVTGVGLPNPANFIGNLFGGAVQAMEGKGIAPALRMIGRYASPTPSGKVLRHAFMSLFRDYRGAPFQSLWSTSAVWVDGRGAVHTGESLAELARREGLHTSMARSESASSLLRMLVDNEGSFIDRLKRDNLLKNLVTKPFNYWQDILLEVSTGIDNLYRVGAFIDELSIGKSPSEAAEVARRVAFDYNAVTDFERETIRPAIMFYTYTRRNMDLQWWTIMNHPSRFLGSLRGIRDAQEIVLGDRAEMLWPEYLDARLAVGMRETAESSAMHGLYAGVGRIAPPLPPGDAAVLVARLLGATTGDAEPRREALSMLSPWWQAPVVLGLQYDIFAGRELDAFNTVPAWLVELDHQALGGLLTDNVFDIKLEQQSDPLSETTPFAPRYQAQNAGNWWAFRNLMPIGGGRSVDTVTAMARADWLSSLVEQGVVQGVVDLSRQYRKAGAPAQSVIEGLLLPATDYLPGVDARPTLVDYSPSKLPDTDELRAGYTREEERSALFGFKPVLLPTATLKLDEIERARHREVDEEKARVRRSDPHVQGR